MNIKNIIFISLALIALSHEVFGARLKDIAKLKGVRENPLIGYGLVVGLGGTGDDQKMFPTLQSIATMLSRMGVQTVPDISTLKIKNVATVMVTASLPPFARNGNRIDVQVLSIGNASSLQGGTLLMTPLRGADNRIYAVAQGNIILGGYSAEGAGGTGVKKNHTTAGIIAGGAIVERELEFSFNSLDKLTYSLNNPDFRTVTRMANSINLVLNGTFAKALDSSTVLIDIPKGFKDKKVELVASIESLQIEPDKRAKIVINEKTGTVIIGEDVRLATVAIAHGNLHIEIQTRTEVSQPLPFSQGETVKTPESNVNVTETEAKLMVVNPGVDINELVKALNAIGVSPRDLMSIFQALKSAGALQADLEIL